MSIATPEGVDIDLTLAGVGSRFVAIFLDQLVQSALLLAIALLITFAGGAAGLEGDLDDGGDALALSAVALGVLILFIVQFGYHVLFEVLAGGRTPGKRWTGLRVVTTGGGPVTFLTSAVRNLVRLIDLIPGFYGVGIVAVLASKRNQRLGDMAAGTLVVRERVGEARPKRRGRRRRRREGVKPVPATATDVETWDLSAITADELATVRRFLERRPTLTPESRSRLARELATRLRPKVVGPSEDIHPEVFLEELAAAKSARL